jgi:hypothetical protein
MPGANPRLQSSASAASSAGFLISRGTHSRRAAFFGRPWINDHPSNKENQMSGTRGGSHEQHVKAGEQSHKNTSHTGSESKSEGEHTRGGTHEQHVKSGQQSHKNTTGSGSGSEGEHMRGGTHEQHVKAGQQSHKNT